MTPTPFASEHLAPLQGVLDEVLAELDRSRAVDRLWGIDHTLWAPDPAEIADRLGWLSVTADMAAAADRLDTFAAGLVSRGITQVVVLGMGGSSLFPEVVARSFDPVAPAPALLVLDSTDPAAVAHVVAHCAGEHSCFIVASKSGGTIETRSHFDFFWDRVGDPERFVVITDPGSELEVLAGQRGIAEVFANRTDIGGRFAALSFFGLVPAAAAGAPWRALVGAADGVAPSLRSGDPTVNAGLRLGALLAASVRSGHDKLTLVIDPRIASFGLWLEQLVAESIGKAGVGIVPVVDEPLGPADVYGQDRLFVAIGEVEHPIGVSVLAEEGHPVVHLALDTPTDLGAQVLIWEVATALCGAALGINPFDQPNVAEAKAATAEVLAAGSGEIDEGSLGAVLGSARAGDYVSIQAYLNPFGPDMDRIADLRVLLRDRLRLATTVGLGPRFLHSTGQLHKGGPPTGVFLQIVGPDPVDAPIPGRAFTFGELKRAQADGDLLTLRAHGLRAVRTSIDELARWVDSV